MISVDEEPLDALSDAERDPDDGWRSSLSSKEATELEHDVQRMADDGCPHHG